MTFPTELSPEEIKRKCEAWEQEHGKLDETNFIKCFVHFVQQKDQAPEDVENILKHLIEVSGVKPCSNCGRYSASPKVVNGTVHLLCRSCCDSILFQELGPREGYV